MAGRRHITYSSGGIAQPVCRLRPDHPIVMDQRLLILAQPSVRVTAPVNSQNIRAKHHGRANDGHKVRRMMS